MLALLTRRSSRQIASTCQRSFSAMVADDNNFAPPPITNTQPCGDIYMWGTSKKGIIPVKLLQEDATSAGGMFSGDEIIIDHPMKLNLQEVDKYLFGDEDNSNKAKIQQIFCGAMGTALVLDDGRCYVVGSNKNGELGIGSDKKESTQPIHIPLQDPVAKVSLGSNLSALLTTTGDLYTFGFGGSRINGMGCLGQGNMDSESTPKLVTSLIEDGCYASDMHCGEYSMTVLTTEGEVLTCGSGSYGRLGNLETVDQLYLEPVELLGAENITQIASGVAFSLALNSGGIIHAWGRNNEGQLGTGMGMVEGMYAMEPMPR